MMTLALFSMVFQSENGDGPEGIKFDFLLIGSLLHLFQQFVKSTALKTKKDIEIYQKF